MSLNATSLTFVMTLGFLVFFFLQFTKSNLEQAGEWVWMCADYFPERLVLGRKAQSVSFLSPSLLPFADTFGIGNPERFQINV